MRLTGGRSGFFFFVLFLFLSRFTAHVLLFRGGLHEQTHLILKIILVASVIFPLVGEGAWRS